MKINKSVSIKNKKASFEYEFVDTLVSGIVLQGTEIKSIRMSKVSINEAYCYFRNSEMFIKNMSITEYDHGTYNNHEARRERKLLLNKNEIIKWERKLKESGLTVIPTKIFINDKGYCKLVIALAKGKKNYDKRESLKVKDAKREIDRSHKF